MSSKCSIIFSLALTKILKEEASVTVETNKWYRVMLEISVSHSITDIVDIIYSNS